MADRIVKGKVQKEEKKSKNHKSNPPKKVSESKLKRRLEAQVFIKIALILIIVFAVTFIDSQKDQKFTEIKTLRAEITQLNKDNDQLEVSIQNSLNLNTIEQAAKDLLGMQKLTAKQTRYINLPKRDYVEPRVEEVTIDNKKSIFEKIINFFNK